MKYEKISLDDEDKAEEEMDKWYIADWKDRNEIIKTIDDAMKPFGLELIVGQAGDDNYYFRVEKR